MFTMLRWPAPRDKTAEGLLLAVPELEGPSRRPTSRFRAVAAAHEEGRQPLERLGRLHGSQSGGPGTRERIRPVLLALARVPDDLGHERGGDTLGEQLVGDGPDAGPLSPEAMIGDLASEGGVIDQADPLEPLERVVDLVGSEPSLPQARLELPAAA